MGSQKFPVGKRIVICHTSHITFTLPFPQHQYHHLYRHFTRIGILNHIHYHSDLISIESSTWIFFHNEFLHHIFLGRVLTPGPAVRLPNTKCSIKNQTWHILFGILQNPQPSLRKHKNHHQHSSYGCSWIPSDG